MKCRAKNLTVCTVFSLASLIVLSIACHGNNVNIRAAHPESEVKVTPAPSKNQSGTGNLNVEHSTKPGIQITDVPPRGAGPDRVETIAGTASGVNIAECKVVVYAGTNVWYVQPYIGSSDTSIEQDGTWHTDTHLGSKYAALLVKKTYKQPETTGKLPDIGGQVLAIATATPK